ncbi:unnamed protein product [Candida verbasci]|uniref:Uncharacterized protein n=1 Tax=Candida verbasci TaxID=1227364 RepID=A0A9W4TRX6_9ASCO|nr:unnamed protein product [Candida verbasci]
MNKVQLSDREIIKKLRSRLEAYIDKFNTQRILIDKLSMESKNNEFTQIFLYNEKDISLRVGVRSLAWCSIFSSFTDELLQVIKKYDNYVEGDQDEVMSEIEAIEEEKYDPFKK